MPGYFEKTLARFGHDHPSKPQHQPHQHAIPTYVATIQYATPADASSPLLKEEKKFIQQVVGTLLYYSRAINATILVALSSAPLLQPKPRPPKTPCNKHVTSLITLQLISKLSSPKQKAS
jgi:hypothetical protein